MVGAFREEWPDPSGRLGRAAIVGSRAPEPQGLLLSKIAIGSSSDPDG
jgi:hypothetical protein